MSIPDVIRALPPDQKLELVHELWDDLASSMNFSLPPAELKEMQRRREELLASPEITIDREELWRRVNGN